MRLETAPVSFRLPSGRTRDGEILYTSHKRDLSPKGRQIDLGVTYIWKHPEHRYSATIGAVHSFNEGHENGVFESRVAAFISKDF